MDPTLSAHPHVSERNADSSVPPPYPHWQPPPPGYHDTHQLDLEASRMNYNRSRRRFRHVFICCVLAFFAMHLVLSVGRSLSSSKHRPSQCINVQAWTMDVTGPKVISAAGSFPHHAQASFALPVWSPEISFISEGAGHTGAFEIVQDLDVGSAMAMVDVRVSYRHLNALEDATVCRTRGEAGVWRLGIFTPTWRHPLATGDDFRFHITLRLPATPESENALFKINSLHTNLPQFEHHLPDLAGSMIFDTIDLKTLARPITVKSLVGNYIRLHSYGGAIRGTFNASTSLILETSNAPITISANLFNDNETGKPTTLAMATYNAHIESNIALISETSTGSHGSYSVHARSANAPVRLSFVDAPAFSLLALEAETSNSPVRARLHPAYEGTFDLTTSWFIAPEVSWRPGAEDPTGEGRSHRAYLEENRKGHVSGRIAWSPELDERPQNGSVVLRTVHSPMSLEM